MNEPILAVMQYKANSRKRQRKRWRPPRLQKYIWVVSFPMENVPELKLRRTDTTLWS